MIVNVLGWITKGIFCPTIFWIVYWTSSVVYPTEKSLLEVLLRRIFAIKKDVCITYF
jgi:hypothetical protein